MVCQRNATCYFLIRLVDCGVRGCVALSVTPNRPLEEFLLDALVGSRTGKLVGDTDAIEDGAIVG